MCSFSILLNGDDFCRPDSLNVFIVNQSIRDMYSAGGRMNIYINNVLYKRTVVKSVSNLLISIDKIRDIFYEGTDISREISYYSDYSSNRLTPFDAWKKQINLHTKKLIGLDIETILNLTIDGIIGNNVMLKDLDSYQISKYQSLR